MINYITGQLVAIDEESAVIQQGGVGIGVSIPRYAVGELAACRGREVTIHTLLLLDSNHASGQIEPQLIGFPHPQDKVFFRRFISVKGVGARKAIKALTEPVARVAEWIESGDLASLKRLPGIGARNAELIVAELRGKLKDFALTATGRPRIDSARFSPAQRDALEFMVALGDGRTEVERWLERAAQLHSDLDTTDGWVRAAYRVKTGAEG